MIGQTICLDVAVAGVTERYLICAKHALNKLKEDKQE